MSMHWMIWLIVFLIVIFIILKIVKTILKAMAIIISITILILIIGSIILVMDISDFKGNFPSSEKIILLNEKDSVLVGVTLDGEVKQIPDSDLADYSAAINQKEYDKVLGNNYKLIIISAESIEELNFNDVTVNQTRIRKPDVMGVLRSNSPMKLDVFSFLVRKISDDQLFIFQQYKKGNLIVYPETPVFKLVMAIPSTFIKSIVKRGVEEVATRVTEGFNESISQVENNIEVKNGDT